MCIVYSDSSVPKIGVSDKCNKCELKYVRIFLYHSRFKMAAVHLGIFHRFGRLASFTSQNCLCKYSFKSCLFHKVLFHLIFIILENAYLHKLRRSIVTDS